MFWDNVSGIYDLIETVYNGKVYHLHVSNKVAAQKV